MTGGAAEADLRLAILNVPGIQDIVFERQAGTYTCFVYGISPAVPPSLLQMVQAQINATTAWPLTGTAVSPDLIGISLATTITFVNGATPAEQQTAIANAVSGPGPSPPRAYNLSRARARIAPRQATRLLGWKSSSGSGTRAFRSCRERRYRGEGRGSSQSKPSLLDGDLNVATHFDHLARSPVLEVVAVAVLLAVDAARMTHELAQRRLRLDQGLSAGMEAVAVTNKRSFLRSLNQLRAESHESCRSDPDRSANRPSRFSPLTREKSPF